LGIFIELKKLKAKQTLKSKAFPIFEEAKLHVEKGIPVVNMGIPVAEYVGV